MAEPAQSTPPICERCGRFLRAEEELRIRRCSRCPAPAADEPNDERFCCASDPPCPSCPYAVGWD